MMKSSSKSLIWIFAFSLFATMLLLLHPAPVQAQTNSMLLRGGTLQVNYQLYRAFLESFAAEMGARMSAMDSATTNSEEMIDRLTLQFNQARQAAITKELMNIVNDANAMT